VTTDRCPGCHAAVTPGAPWCTLCYADLRAPAPAPEPAPEYALATAATPQSTAVLPPDPILEGPIAQAAPVARRELAGWPCGCGSVVPMADDVCSHCGRSFLPAEGMPSVSLPVVGDVLTLERSQRIVLTIVAAVVVTGLFMALLFIGGSIL
jgi:hypothetical protein